LKNRAKITCPDFYFTWFSARNLLKLHEETPKRLLAVIDKANNVHTYIFTLYTTLIELTILSATT
jgi:hypothetical protein